MDKSGDRYTLATRQASNGSTFGCLYDNDAPQPFALVPWHLMANEQVENRLREMVRLANAGVAREAFSQSPILFFDHQGVKFPVGKLRVPDEEQSASSAGNPFSDLPLARTEQLDVSPFLESDRKWLAAFTDKLAKTFPEIKSFRPDDGFSPVVAARSETEVAVCPQGHHLKDGPCMSDYCRCDCARCRQQCEER